MKSSEIHDAEDHITAAAVAESATSLVPTGAVLVVARSGILRRTLPVAIARREVALNQDLKALVPYSGIDARYVAYVLRAFEQRILHDCTKDGTTVQSIEMSALKQFVIPVAPVAEQPRIADALDELLSDVDAGVASLEQARAKLKAYRTSVLKAAVDGTLTAEWREEHPRVEPASDLLARILAERRQRWEEEQITRYVAKGQRAPKLLRARHQAPTAPAAGKRTHVPEGWCHATIDQLATVGTGATPNRGMATRYYAHGTVPWVTSSCVNAPIVSEPSEYVTEDALNECNLTLYPAGTLLLAMYGEGTTRGKFTELAIPSTTNQALAALVAADGVRPFLKLFLAKNYDEMRRVATGGVQPNLNLGLVREVTLPLPPLAEQDAIVEIVEAQLSVVGHLEADLDAKLRTAQALRQSVLRHAFTGRLVPQDPADEPASALLARIAAERTVRDATPRAANGKRPRGRRDLVSATLALDLP